MSEIHHSNGSRRHGSRRRRHGDDDYSTMYAEAKDIAEKPELMAREILLLKKELNRLHYKVKSGFSDGRTATIIGQIVIIVLLGVILLLLLKS